MGQIFIIFVLLLILKPILCQDTYDTDDDNAHGVRIDGNDQSDCCIAGTYKKEVGCGSCTICPPQTKNPAKKPML